ncbi:MAG: hypothetical protein R3236_00760 [Phycisphaeraceae bacterium]|nr:hypothetical protein [Phycisphaeraceae bacterium]
MAEASSGDPNRSWFGSLGLEQLVGSASAAMRHMWLAFWLIIFLFIAGIVMNEVWGLRVVPGEFQKFRQSSVEEFQTWRTAELARLRTDQRGGVFTETLKIKLTLLGDLTVSVVELRIGFEELTPSETSSDAPPTVLGTLRKLFLILPAWLWTAHGGFLCAYLVVFAMLWAVFGGALSRQTIVEAATGRTVAPSEAMAFAWSRRWHYLLAPLMPLGLALGMGLAISFFGLMFSTQLIDFLAAIFFIVALGLGAGMAVLLMGWFFAAPLMYPAISAEDTDFMDAATGRSYGMLREHPWRVLIYNFFTLGYGAVTYVFFGLFIFLSVWLTHQATATFATGHFEDMFPEPRFGQLIYEPDHERLDQYKDKWGLTTVAAIIQIEVFAFISLMGAYAISFFFTAYSRIYLLLRQASFGAGFDEIHLDDPPPSAPPTVDEKFEPTGPAPASDGGPDPGKEDKPAASGNGSSDLEEDDSPSARAESHEGDWKKVTESNPLPEPPSESSRAANPAPAPPHVEVAEAATNEMVLPFDPAETRADAAKARSLKQHDTDDKSATETNSDVEPIRLPKMPEPLELAPPTASVDTDETERAADTPADPAPAKTASIQKQIDRDPAVPDSGELLFDQPMDDGPSDEAGSAAELMDSLEQSLEESEPSDGREPEVQVTLETLDELQTPRSVTDPNSRPDASDAEPPSAAELMDSLEMNLEDLDQAPDPAPGPMADGSEPKLPDPDAAHPQPASASDLVAGLEDDER